MLEEERSLPVRLFTEFSRGIRRWRCHRGMRTNLLPLRGLLSALAITTILFTGSAQDADRTPRTLFGGDDKTHHGGWGGPSAHYTTIMGHEALLVGARGGWLIDHGITIGLAGHGLVTNVPNTDYDAHHMTFGNSLRRGSLFRLGYGGLLIEPIIAPMSPIHVSLPVLIGAGGCGYQTFSSWPDDDDLFEFQDDYQAFFVVEPGIDLEINVIKMVRLGVGASYRYTTNIDLPETPKDALHGFNVGLTVKVGSF